MTYQIPDSNSPSTQCVLIIQMQTFVTFYPSTQCVPINQMQTFVTFHPSTQCVPINKILSSVIVQSTHPFNVYQTAKQQPSANSYQPIVHVVPQYCVIFTSSCITFHPWVPKASSSGHICPVSVFCPPPTGPDQTRNSQHSKCCL